MIVERAHAADCNQPSRCRPIRTGGEGQVCVDTLPFASPARAQTGGYAREMLTDHRHGRGRG
eukprot:6186677-Pleurochrysis_carterae.AAC.1